MRRLLLAGAFVLAVPTFGVAAPLCTSLGLVTLQDYIGLGPGGCDIGGATFFDFDSDPSFFNGGTEIAATAVSVTTTALPGGPQLAFGIAGSAGPAEMVGVLIAYSVTGLFFDSATLSMTGGAATDDGVVTVVEDLCLGGSFGADPTTCSGVLESLIDGQDAVGPIGPETQPFLIASFFDVFLDITIDGGGFGSASLNGTVTNQFNAAAAPAAVPEPASMVLVGSGLLAMAARRRHRRL